MDWIKNFDLGRWWKMAIAVGLAIVLASLATKDHGVTLVGFGVIALGFGEWMNHRMQSESMHGGWVTSYPRHNRAMGLTLDAIGIAVALFGLYRIATT
jgi:hypothetical protein